MEHPSQKVNEHVYVNANDNEHVNGNMNENRGTAKKIKLEENIFVYLYFNRVSGGGQYLCVGRIGIQKTVSY